MSFIPWEQGRILSLSPSSYSSKQMAHTSYSSPMTEIIKLINYELGFLPLGGSNVNQAFRQVFVKFYR